MARFIEYALVWLVPSSQMRKLRRREVKRPIEGCTVDLGFSSQSAFFLDSISPPICLLFSKDPGVNVCRMTD